MQENVLRKNKHLAQPFMNTVLLCIHFCDQNFKLSKFEAWAIAASNSNSRLRIRIMGHGICERARGFKDLPAGPRGELYGLDRVPRCVTFWPLPGPAANKPWPCPPGDRSNGRAGDFPNIGSLGVLVPGPRVSCESPSSSGSTPSSTTLKPK